ncbi:leader peptidase (prepilin peptidase)/N-methyltransferase [Orenia metallireducens]|uniref:prepilin peptidase n=1 Tax=Orenia metallireducens TaxID=1413210 RepID=UPI000D074186|nr:A24 family peptidase [Orenia metallireducens]PRX31140.1 leader peptidase (prepilin peptidase)/N-methyltransferase [Orenia metallireducens]
MLTSVIIFILGLIIGSFLNVVIYRVPEGESIVFPASHCPNCQTNLKIRDLVPVVSFLFSGAKCRYCKEKISWQYPLVELLTGIIFLLLYWKYNLNIQFLSYLILSSLLITVSVIDFKYLIIPNQINYFGIIIGFILSIFFLNQSIYSVLLGILIPAAILLLIAIISKGGMGMGDVKLIAMVGAFLGAKYGVAAIFLGAFIGSVVGGGLMLTGVKGRKDRIPFGPFISMGALVMVLWGDEIINWYLNFIM